MIPATLPAPAPDAPLPGGRPDRAGGPEFDRALDRAAREHEGDAGPVVEDEECPDVEVPEDAREAPGADGRAQALAAMPIDVPARAVVGTDVRPGDAITDAPALPRATGSDSVAPGPDGEATVEGAPGEPSPVDGQAVLGLEQHDRRDRVAAAPAEAADAALASADDPSDANVDDSEPVRSTTAASFQDDARNGAAASSRDDARNGAAASFREDARNGAAASSDQLGDAAGSPGRLDADREGVEPIAPSSPSVADLAPSQVDAVGPTLAAPTVTGPADVAAPAAPTPVAPPVAEQLVAHVTPLAAGPDGTQELTIELRPVELGHVRLEVTLDDGVLSVRVHADDPASRRLLAQSLGDLRHALTEAGISAGSLDVGDPRSGAGAGDGDRTSDRPAGGAPSSRGDGRATDRDPSRPAAVSRTAVDVLL